MILLEISYQLLAFYTLGARDFFPKAYDNAAIGKNRRQRSVLFYLGNDFPGTQGMLSSGSLGK